MANFNKIIPVYKPRGISTYDLIRVLKKKLKTKNKIGHGGTLDPMASGLVLLLFGKLTKEFEKIKELPKTYIAGIYFGVYSDTYDIAGNLKLDNCQANKKQEIVKVVLSFKKKYFQKIPPFSAVKYKGEPLYKLARKGIFIKKRKEVKIDSIKILSFYWPILFLKIKVSGGFYVRQLAVDIAKEINCSAVLFYLERVGIGNFSIKKSLNLRDILSLKNID